MEKKKPPMTDRLRKAIPLKGKVAFLDDEFVRIVSIEPYVRQEKNMWGQVKEEFTDLKYVWYIPVGDNRGKAISSNFAGIYNWEKLIAEANRIIHQANLVQKEEHEAA